MNFSATFAEALRAMAMNRLRTALTMLGMIIGVAAVVLMMAVGQGAQESVKRSIDSMGSNLFIILSGASTSGGLRFGTGSAPTLTLNDAAALRSVENISAVAPVVMGAQQLVYESANWSTMVTGAAPDFFRVRSWSVEQGSEFGDADIRAANRVALLGQTVAENLFGDVNPVGKTIRIKNRPFTVLGVLAAKGQSLDGRDQDDSVIVPVTTAQQQLQGNQFPGSVRQIMVQVRSAQAMADAERDMTDLLRQRHRTQESQESDFNIRNLSSVAESAAESTRVMSLLLGAIASVSLLVGGIGIMNIMLVSVTERTREIGIRIAVGARQRDILRQFLLEAVLICLAGGMIGTLTGVSLAWLISSKADMQVVVSGQAALLAFGFSSLIGIFFGFYPARKAATMNPVEALRHE